MHPKCRTVGQTKRANLSDEWPIWGWVTPDIPESYGLLPITNPNKTVSSMRHPQTTINHHKPPKSSKLEIQQLIYWMISALNVNVSHVVFSWCGFSMFLHWKIGAWCNTSVTVQYWCQSWEKARDLCSAVPLPATRKVTEMSTEAASEHGEWWIYDLGLLPVTLPTQFLASRLSRREKDQNQHMLQNPNTSSTNITYKRW